MDGTPAGTNSPLSSSPPPLLLPSGRYTLQLRESPRPDIISGRGLSRCVSFRSETAEQQVEQIADDFNETRNKTHGILL